MGQVHKIRGADVTPTFAHAVETFLVAHTLAGAWSTGTAAKYRQTLTAIAARLAGSPAGADVAALDTPAGAARLAEAFTAAFGTTAPATRLRHLSTLRSACAWWRTNARWISTDPTANWARPKVAVDTTRALTRDQVAGLWRLDASVRDKALWRLLYETAARAEEILNLDIGDLELPNKRARVTSKGGATEWVFWQTGTALLLPRLLAGRGRGPLFLADRRPTRAVATNDLCPVTGRARLSYRRAAEIFEHTTRPLADPAHQTQGWTLHQLRHSMLTHEAENGTATPTLLARSRHASVRSLARYARPGPEAVAAHVAATDPAARKRHRRPLGEP
ncbi:tyrosine-type recombinase/integrase [Krasilnikovia sp. MM14-A1259]|uniref:tyrosine-type recombinase/integrase n=1 Tax=Krasilnikovia sp. MM14-A1259 TaxID=3373539 RepID=UPI003828236B